MSLTCSVCGREVHDGLSGWPMWTHSKRHIREADAILGRETDDYDEVRAVLAGRLDDVDGPQVPLTRWSA